MGDLPSHQFTCAACGLAFAVIVAPELVIVNVRYCPGCGTRALVSVEIDDEFTGQIP